MKKTLLKESLSQRISDILRLEIIENAIKEDEFFNETELATRFGVSRGPVREALRILETDCLVSTQPKDVYKRQMRFCLLLAFLWILSGISCLSPCIPTAAPLPNAI